ncbi:hypothetical protein OG520_39560 (plasmid) [Streptomyces sp. NBC_00984]|uniref:hypothetical protein n=1 Tax=Streptomyces sp. NBC_00984 TaxID=2903700 RepID=UPI00386846B1|nr:hypothetical protein OG520_00030 [Streptomyces sp. NBC_00984]WSX33158.1 hypothetical protein OG520_39560 [Streptomyces sp. NBC_00984]
MDRISLTLAARQKGLCPLCGQALIVGAEYEPDSPREWIDWFDAMKKRLHKHHLTLGVVSCGGVWFVSWGVDD